MQKGNCGCVEIYNGEALGATTGRLRKPKVVSSLKGMHRQEL